MRYTFLSSPLLLCWVLSVFLKFEITEVWPIFLFILSVCVSHCLQVGDAWREDRGLSLRHHCLLAPPRVSWVGKWGLKGPECIELLSESWLCTHWPYYNIYSFKANAKQQSLQQSGFHSHQEQRSLLSALAGFTVVSFHLLAITFSFSFLQYYLILAEDKRRWPNGREK